MGTSVTYAQIRTNAKARADMARSKFIDDDGWLELINKSAQKLYDKLLKAMPDYFTIEVPLEVNGTDQVYRLPDTFYKLRGIDYRVGGRLREMRPYVFEERHRYQNSG